MEAVNACLGGKLRTLEACTFSLLRILAGTGASHPRSCSKLIFSFKDHPYILKTVIIKDFLKTVIIKEYYLDITGKTWLHGGVGV